MNHLNQIIRTLRPPFLLLTLVCVFLGVSLSLSQSVTIDYISTVLILMGAISAHMSANALNEYYDFQSGLDLKTTKTPFSGGSGALPEAPHLAPITAYIGWLMLLVCVCVGLYFVYQIGIQLLPIGLIGVILIVTYTQWLNRFPLLCLIAPGLGFALMIVGTFIILTGEQSSQVYLIALIPFFLINNLLLLNQYPDIEADQSFGRRTFPIVFGITKSHMIYALFMFLAYSLIVIYTIIGHLSHWSLIALIPLGLSMAALYGAVKHGSNIKTAPQFMAMNVMATLLTPLLLGLAMLLK